MDILTTCDLARTTLYTLGPELMKLGLTHVGSPKPFEPGYEVDVTLDQSSAQAWMSFTSAHVGTTVAFIRDGLVISSATIQEPAPAPGNGVGLFADTAQAADQLVRLVNRPA